jgi:hypothetical protein
MVKYEPYFKHMSFEISFLMMLFLELKLQELWVNSLKFICLYFSSWIDLPLNFFMLYYGFFCTRNQDAIYDWPVISRSLTILLKDIFWETNSKLNENHFDFIIIFHVYLSSYSENWLYFKMNSFLIFVNFSFFNYSQQL